MYFILLLIMSLFISSINANGLRNVKKRNYFFTWLIEKKYDLICVQETHCTENDIEQWSNEWKDKGGCDSFWACGTSESRGVGIFLRKEIPEVKISEIHNEQNHDGRKLAVRIESEKFEIIIQNLYTPSVGSERKLFLKKLNLSQYKFKSENKRNHHMICGDFNCAPKKLDRFPQRNTDDIGTNELNEFITTNNLCDYWRLVNPDAKKISFQRGNSKSRIDYFLTCQNLGCNLLSPKICHFPFSDHDIVSLKVKLHELTRGPGTWIMNESVIDSDNFKHIFEIWWTQRKLEKRKFENVREWWDNTKVKI